MAVSTLPELGQLVQVRSRRWVVANITPSSLGNPVSSRPSSPQNLISLLSVEDDGLGEELRVVWELELGSEVIEKNALPDPTGFDAPDRLEAFLDSVRWGASSTADVRTIQSPFRSGIEIEDYQLDPVVRAIQMPRVNLLISDDVGLGKTIEAGMVALELLLRHRARKMLIVCPATLQIQWQEQMRDKFGLDFRIVDANLMKDLRRRRGIHINPWNHFPRLITSIDFLKRERPLRLFREMLPGPSQPIYPRKFDLLIVDEAHNCAPSGTGRYATDSLRTQALRLLVPHFEHKLFLTATPHNGYRESFSALLELLDGQRFARGTEPDKAQLKAVMIRRMKRELPLDAFGKPRFPKRRLEPLEVAYTDAERRIHTALREYGTLRVTKSKDNAESMATDFVLKTMKKRLFSSPAAFLTTLLQHEHSIKNARKNRPSQAPNIRILKQEIDRVEEDYADDENHDEATKELLTTASLLFSDLSKEESTLLNEMKQWAEFAARTRDTKSKTLVDWLSRNIRPDGKWSNNRVIIFTEYRATQKWLMEVLAAEGFSGNDRLLTMFGGMSSDDREEIKNAFQADPEISPVRILLATDSAAEGINLQNHCARLIHYEIPWNPNKLEQRNGRVDRHGQKGIPGPNGEKFVDIFHFVSEGYQARQNQLIAAKDLDADLEFLMRVAQKVETIREDLGTYGNVLADDVEHAMLGKGYTLGGTNLAESRAEPVRRMLKLERDLAKQIRDLLDQYNETRRDLHLTPENIKKVVDVALELADQPSLKPIKDIASNQLVYQLPELKGTWGTCSEGLLHPHTHERRNITFDHSLASGRDDIILVHLNHRLVQMCLRLLRAEVWATQGRKRLHRFTARIVNNSQLSDLAVLAYARLVVIGSDGQRLHEELIMAGGYIRQGKLVRANVGEVERWNEFQSNMEPADEVKSSCQRIWHDIEGSLVSALEARMKDKVASLEKKLNERSQKEIQDVHLILTELKKTIEKELAEPEYSQLTLFSETEKEQLDRNRDFLKHRLLSIPKEIQTESEAIARRFASPQARMFPVAVAFLVPERMGRG